MSKGNIGVTSDNIFPVIKKFLYSDHEIFLRELISNAVDATTKLKVISRQPGAVSIPMDDMRVRVSIDKKKKTLTVSDHGIGMTAEEVDKYINQIAFSGAEEFVNKYKDKTEAIIGHFGLGFYSAFMVISGGCEGCSLELRGFARVHDGGDDQGGARNGYRAAHRR